MSCRRTTGKSLRSRKQTLSFACYDTLCRVCVCVCVFAICFAAWKLSRVHFVLSHVCKHWKCRKKCKKHHQGSRLDIDAINKLSTERRVGQIRWKRSLTKLQLMEKIKECCSSALLISINLNNRLGLHNSSITGRKAEAGLRLCNINSNSFNQNFTQFITQIPAVTLIRSRWLGVRYDWHNWLKELHFLLLLSTRNQIHNKSVITFR